MNKSNRQGFTLVELLVVIAIIGILIALLVPAVQAAREAARRTRCSNNLKQLGDACLLHLEKYNRFPTGGWGEMWVGLPHRGTRAEQPGGWIYNILPYMDQQNMHDLGMAGTAGGDYQAGSNERIQTPLAILYCPTRRSVVGYPAVEQQARRPHETATVPEITRVGRTDYAINGGSQQIGEVDGPDSLEDADSYDDWPDNSNANGISYSRSLVMMAHVRDGASNTYLAGEKYLNPSDYTTGLDPGDNATAYSGDEEDLIRWAGGSNMVPLLDRPDVPHPHHFGSAHSGGCNFVFCDGSVHLINYAIDWQVNDRLADRSDGETIDASQFD